MTSLSEQLKEIQPYVLAWLQTAPSGVAGLGVFNVREYGATGDGVTLDTAAIQAALDAAHTAGGGVVWFPAGVYLIGDELVYYANTMLSGVPGGSILQNSTGRGASDYIMLIPDAATTVTHVLIENLVFDQRSDSFGFSSSDQCVSVNEVADLTVRNCVFRNVVTMAIWADTKTADTLTQNVVIDRCTIENSEGGGISIFGKVQDWHVTNCVIYSCKDDGIAFQNLTTGERPANLIISHNSIINCNRRNSTSSTPHAILVFCCENVVIADNFIDTTCASAISVQYGADTDHSDHAIVQGNIVRNAGITPDSTTGVPGHGIMALTSDNVQIIDNIVEGSRQYGIAADTIDWLTVAHNRLEANSGGTISIASCTNVTQVFNGEAALTLPGNLHANGVAAGTVEMRNLSIANNGTAQLGNVAAYQKAMGFVLVGSLEDGSVALFALTAGNGVAYEISDPMTQFSAVQGTASMTNVYNEGAPNYVYRIENKRGGTRNYVIHLFVNGD